MTEKGRWKQNLKRGLSFFIMTLVFISATNDLYGDKITVLMGHPETVGQQQYIAPNIEMGNPLKGKWNDGSRPLKASETKGNEVKPSGYSQNFNDGRISDPSATKGSIKHLHIKEVAEEKTPLKDAKIESLNEVIAISDGNESGNDDGGGVRDFKGSEGGIWVATKDGSLKISPCLKTIKGATLTIRLLEPDGSEVNFKGQSLLFWKRYNDKALAPLSWKGEEDRDSMFLQSDGDYSPREDLGYSIEVKKGQKVVIEISGTPIESNSVKLTPL